MHLLPFCIFFRVRRFDLQKKCFMILIELLEHFQFLLYDFSQPLDPATMITIMLHCYEFVPTGCDHSPADPSLLIRYKTLWIHCTLRWHINVNIILLFFSHETNVNRIMVRSPCLTIIIQVINHKLIQCTIVMSWQV